MLHFLFAHPNSTPAVCCAHALPRLLPPLGCCPSKPSALAPTWLPVVVTSAEDVAVALVVPALVLALVLAVSVPMKTWSKVRWRGLSVKHHCVVPRHGMAWLHGSV